MPYTISTQTFAQAKAKVAASSGSEGVTAMETLAGRAVQDALDRWSSFWNWKYLQTTAPAISLLGAVDYGMRVDTGANPDVIKLLNVDVSATLAAGDILLGSTNAYIPSGVFYVRTAVASGSDTDVTLSLDPITVSGSTAYAFPAAANNTTGTVTIGRIDYTLPTAARTVYSVRTVANNRVLRPINQRSEDRNCPAVYAGVPDRYTLYRADGASARLRVLPAPSSNDYAIVRYLREPAVASASGDVLDIPRDAELCISSLAKGYYLMDKGEEKAAFWAQVGEQQLRELRGREGQESDEEPRFSREGSLYPQGHEELY